ncbi:MAG: hypothetical protein K8I00_11525, partial [Candidatus Omnitrophica bacterium]|nr:hypothetical protein [Candidatus Omnitrophota bacterium]
MTGNSELQDKVNVKRSDASSGGIVLATGSTDSGNNTNWFFGSGTIWDGGGVDNNWTTPQNWLGDVVPSPTDVAIFDITSSKDATIDGNITIMGLLVDSSYTETITQGSGITVDLGTYGYSQEGGSFVASDTTINVAGDWNYSAGTFTANTSTVILDATAGTQTVTSGTISFNDVTISQTDDTLVINGTMDINGDLSITSVAIMNTGTLAVAGDVTTTDALISGTAIVHFDGATDQTLSASGGTGELTGVSINKTGGTLTIQDTINIDDTGWTYTAGTVDAGTSTVVFTDTATVASGTMMFNNVSIIMAAGTDNLAVTGTMDVNGSLTITVLANLTAGDITVAGNVVTTDTAVDGAGIVVIDGAGAQNLNAAGGTGELPGVRIDKTGGTLTIQDNINIDGGGWTYVAGTVDAGTSTVIFTDSLTATAGTMSFANLSIAGGSTAIISVTGTMDVSGTLSLISLSTINSGPVTVSGNVVTVDSGVGGTAIIILDGAGAQTLSASGGTGELPGAEIDKSGGTLTIQDIINIDTGGWTYTMGMVDAGTSTVNLTNTMTVVTGTMSFANVSVNASSAGVITVSGTMDVGGTLTITSVGSINSGPIAAGGNVVTVDTGVGGTSLILFDGAGSQTLSAAGATGELPGVEINKTTGTLTMQDSINIDTGGWLYTAGNVDAGSSTVILTNDMTVTSGTMSFANVNMSGSSAMVITVAGTMDVNGTLTFTGLGSVNTGVVAAGGNVVNLDTGVSGSGKLTFDGPRVQSFNLTGFTAGINIDVDVNKSGGLVHLLSALTLDAAGQDLTVVEGTLDISGNNLTFSGTSFTVQDGGVYQLRGNETSSAPTLNAGSTVSYNGTAGPYTVKDWGYDNLRVASDHLVGYWKLDEITGGGIADSSSKYARHMFPFGPAGANTFPQPSTSVPTVGFSNARSLDFDGTDDFVKSAGFTELGTANQPYTIAAWINRDAGETDGNIVHVANSSAGAGWCVSFLTLDSSRIQAHGWTGGLTEATGTTTLNAGEWYHVATTWDATNGLKVYVNGVNEATTTQATYSASGASNFVFLGFYGTSCAGSESSYFAGKMDDARVYNRALTATEISALASGEDLMEHGHGEDFNLAAAESLGGDLLVVNGTFDLVSYDLTVTGTVSNDDVIRLEGGQTVSITNMDEDSGLVRYDGSGTYTDWALDANYYNLEFIGSGSWTAGSDMDVNGTIVIESGTVADGGNSILLAGNWYRPGGTYTATGTIDFDGGDQGIWDSTTFNHFRKNVSTAATLTFETLERQTIAGVMTMNGQAGQLLTIRGSEISLIQWEIDPQGARSVSYLDVTDSWNVDMTEVDCTNNCVNSGNNTEWLFTTPVISVSGVVYTDEGSTTISAGKTVAISIDGAAAAGTDDTDGGGAYSITGLMMNAGDTLTLYLDGETEQGVTVTVASDEDISGVDIYVDYLIVRSDNQGFISNTLMADGDDNADTDITDIYSVTAGNTLQVGSGVELLIPVMQTYISQGAIETHHLDIEGTLDASGNYLTVNGNWENSGSFSMSGTVTFQGGTTQTIDAGGTATSVDDTTRDFPNLVITNNSFLQMINTELEVDTMLTINSGSTLDLNGQTLDLNGILSNDGTLRMQGAEGFEIGTFDSDSGLVMYDGTSSVTINATLSAYYDLTFDEEGAANPTFTLPDINLTVNGSLIIADAVLTNDDDKILTVVENMVIQDTLTMAAGDIRVGSNWDATGGAFTASGNV